MTKRQKSTAVLAVSVTQGRPARDELKRAIQSLLGEEYLKLYPQARDGGEQKRMRTSPVLTKTSLSKGLCEVLKAYFVEISEKSCSKLPDGENDFKKSRLHGMNSIVQCVIVCCSSQQPFRAGIHFVSHV